MKPFLLLATRPEDVAADDEYRGFLDAGGLAPNELVRIRVEAAPLPRIDLDEYSGVIIGGSPFNAGDDESTKSDVQRRVESDLAVLLDDILARDFPLLGACYGVGLLSVHLGGVVDRSYSEAVGPARVRVSPAGEVDPLFGRLAPEFDAYVGHKEACSRLPSGAVLLATGADCPVQAFRVGDNVYATQFHPELTREGIITRIRTYRDSGYFDPASMDELINTIGESQVTEPAALVRAFVERFGD